MILIIGGRSQGKRAYAVRELLIAESDILENLQDLIREDLLMDKNPKNRIERILKENPGVCIICDEIGAGIVPLEQSERDYRDLTGEICCELAKRAEHVYRVNCGIGQVLK